jgi:hypothetical protein
MSTKPKRPSNGRQRSRSGGTSKPIVDEHAHAGAAVGEPGHVESNGEHAPRGGKRAPRTRPG